MKIIKMYERLLNSGVDVPKARKQVAKHFNINNDEIIDELYDEYLGEEM